MPGRSMWRVSRIQLSPLQPTLRLVIHVALLSYTALCAVPVILQLFLSLNSHWSPISRQAWTDFAAGFSQDFSKSSDTVLEVPCAKIVFTGNISKCTLGYHLLQFFNCTVDIGLSVLSHCYFSCQILCRVVIRVSQDFSWKYSQNLGFYYHPCKFICLRSPASHIPFFNHWECV